MTFVCVAPERGVEGLLRVIRTACDLDREHAEFDLDVRTGFRRRGIARRLLKKAIGPLRESDPVACAASRRPDL